MSAPRVVQPGDEYVPACEGGVIRRPVPGVGLVFEHPDGDKFVALDDVGALVDAARKLPERRVVEVGDTPDVPVPRRTPDDAPARAGSTPAPATSRRAAVRR